MSGTRTLEDDYRCGGMARTVTPEDVPRVESMIKKDPKIAYAERQDIMKISSGSLTRILHDCFGVRKRCACWVPHDLSEEQRRGRVDWCTHILRKFDGERSPLRLGHHNRRRNVSIPIQPRDEATVGGVGLPRCEPTQFYSNRSASKQNSATLQPYSLRRERQLRLTGMSITVCLSLPGMV